MHRALLWRTGGKSVFRPSTHAEKLHYYDIPGRGSLGTVVLLHGASQGAIHYLRVILALVPHYGRILAIDAPAHGLSSVPDTLSPHILSEAVTELLDDLLEAPAVVFGTSLGGAMALRYGLNRASRVSELCVLSPAGAPLSEGDRRRLLAMFEMDRHRDARAFMRQVAHRPSPLSGVIAIETRRRFRSTPMRQLFNAFATGQDELSAADIHGLVPPVRLLWGKRERILPPSNLLFFKEHLPIGRRTIIEPAHFAHAAFLEYPREVANHIVHSGVAAARREDGAYRDTDRSSMSSTPFWRTVVSSTSSPTG